MNNIQEANQGQVEQVPFGTVQHNIADILPTSPEIGYLWSSYLAESMSVCFLKSYNAHQKTPRYILFCNEPLMFQANE